MQNKILVKSLVIGVIILFIGISFIPEITANDNYTDDVDDKSIDNFKFRTEDDFEEIITLTRGEGHIDWINRRGLFRGSLNIGVCSRCEGIKLSGLRRSNGSIERYYHKVVPGEGGIKIPIFIGFIHAGPLGIAIGNIEYGMG